MRRRENALAFMAHNTHCMLDEVQEQLAMSHMYAAAAGIMVLRMAVQSAAYKHTDMAVDASRLIRSVYDCAYYTMLQYDLVPTTLWSADADDDDVPF